jgi:hypothetical protein
MQLWIDIVIRELAMLATLLALGIGPVSYLGRRFDSAARVAIAPAFGLSLATCVFTTLIWFTAARNTFWLLPVMAAISVTVAIRRTRRASNNDVTQRHWWTTVRLRPRDVIALAIVCMVVAAPLSYTLHERDSVGPTGFLVWDADGYTATADGIEQQSIRQAERPAPENSNFVRKAWQVYAASSENIDASPLAANLDLLLGLHATDTQSLFLIVFLVAGALGAFAAVRYAAPKPPWAAPLAGVLFAGPLFLQLMADGSQAAICGLTLILPIVTIATEALRDRRFANLVLFALLASGLAALYPLWVPGVALSGGVVLVAIAILSWRRHRLSWRALGRSVAQVGIVVTLVALFNLVSFTRNLRFWRETILNRNLGGKPVYHLPISVIPGWVLQTRQFFFLTDLAHASVSEVLIGVILPTIFIVVILVGLRHRPWSLILVSTVFVFAALAEYSSVASQCSYCVDRDTLPIVPLSIVLLALGVTAIVTVRRRWLRWFGIVVAIAAVVAAGEQTRTERLLFADDSYFLDDDSRTLLSDLPSHPGPVDLEGYGEDPDRAAGELSLAYSLVFERNHGEVSVPSEYGDYGGLRYLGGPNPGDPQFDPDYRYVLTRLGGVQTGRRVIARAGPLALEERTTPLDATITSGIAVPMIRLDTQGLASVVGPLHLLLLGAGSAPASIMLRFQTIDQATAPPQPGVQAQSTPHQLTVCIHTTGTNPIRRVTLELEGQLFRGTIPTEEFARPEPSQGITLTTMRALRHCKNPPTPARF